MAHPVDSLPAPLSYFPLSARPFEFSAGLRPLPASSHHPLDQIFQLDQQWPQYRQNKLDARDEHFDKYVCRANLTPATEAAACALIVQQLRHEHPALFSLDDHTLHCALSAETLTFDENWALPATSPYHDSLDALCCQIQEDLAIIEVDDRGRDRISYLHLCAPNHWAAQDKLDHSFLHAHAPIPAMERINRHSEKLVHSLIDKGPFERFAWGLATDTRLNHHPLPPAGVDADAWRGRAFDPAQPRLYLRIERQTTTGLPEQRALLFTIRSYHRDVTTLDTEQRRVLCSTITSMTPAVKSYKGLADTSVKIIDFLMEISA